MQTNGPMNGRATRISPELLHDVSITNSQSEPEESLALTPNRWPVPASLSEIPSCINAHREYSVRSKCSNRRRALSTNYSSCSARCAARAGHTCTGVLAEQRDTKREREKRRRLERVQRLFHSFQEPRISRLGLRVLSPYATIGANWTPIQGPRGSVEWKEERREEGEVAKRSRRGRGRGWWPVQHVCPSCLVSFRSQGALVCSSFRVVSSFASSGARVQAGHAHLSRIYRPPVFPVLSARGIP